MTSLNFLNKLTIHFDASEQFDIYVFFLGGNFRYFLLAVLVLIIAVFVTISIFEDDSFWFGVNFVLEVVKTTVANNMGTKKFFYAPYLPLFYAMFFLILIFNLAGLIPFTYTLTSLLVIPFFLSCINFVFTTIMAVRKYGISFFAGFLPAGTNLFIAPLLILIEMVSYFIKIFSLAVRLFANMFAGHVLVKVLLSLAWALIIQVSLLPVFLAAALSLLIFAILALELFICCLQAYVFINLASIYLDQVVSFLEH